MSSQELKANFKVATSPSHHQTRTIIKISKHEKRVEESDDKKNSQHQQRSAWSNEATSDQHRLHTYSMFYQNIEMGNEDFQEAASEATVLSSESGEKLHRHVLKIDLSQPSSNSANKSKCLSRRNVTTMSINQDRRGGKMKPFDGNLSDDQKLVLSVSDGASQCEIRNKSEMKHLNANVKGISLSGKCSPYEDHLDSGTCSDAEVISFQSSSESPQPPPVPPKGGNKTTRQKQHALSDSFCSDASSASSSDSVQISHSGSHLISPDLIRSINDQHKAALLPSSLLIDIRNHPATFNDGDDQDKESQDEHESNYLDLCNSDTVNEKMMMNYYSGDSFYKFHINEHLSYDLNDCKMMIHDESDESFAGIKDLRSGTSTIRSAKGTIRGVKNRVRNGIATFLQMQQTTVKVGLQLYSYVYLHDVERSALKKEKLLFFYNISVYLTLKCFRNEIRFCFSLDSMIRLETKSLKVFAFSKLLHNETMLTCLLTYRVAVFKVALSGCC